MKNTEFIRMVMYTHAKKRMRDKTTAPALARIDECILQVQGWLLRRDFVPSAPIHTQSVEVSNGKVREIDYVPYWPDTVMHWVLIDAASGAVVPKMDPYCVAGIRGRGPHRCMKKVEQWMRTDVAGTKYGAELDIHHCFPDSAHEFIKRGYRRLIKDSCWLWLADTIVDSFCNGLPIGYPTSHWFQNMAMTEFDRYVRSLPGVAHYYRYVDNVHLFGPNKRKLRTALVGCTEWLAGAGYTVNRNWQVYRLDYLAEGGTVHRGRGADGLGFVVMRDHTIFRKRTTKRLGLLCLRIKRRGGVPSAAQARSAACRIGQLKHADMYRFKAAHVDGVIRYRKIREVIKNADCGKRWEDGGL